MSTSTRRNLNRPNPPQCILRRSSFQQDRIPSPRIRLTYLKRDNIFTTRHLFNLSVDERYRLFFWKKKRLLSDSEVRWAWQREAYHSIQWLHRLISQHKNITTQKRIYPSPALRFQKYTFFQQLSGTHMPRGSSKIKPSTHLLRFMERRKRWEKNAPLTNPQIFRYRSQFFLPFLITYRLIDVVQKLFSSSLWWLDRSVFLTCFCVLKDLNPKDTMSSGADVEASIHTCLMSNG